MKAAIGRIIKVMVMAKVTWGMYRPNSCATGAKTKVRRKKSSASRVHPRKQAMKVLRCVRFSDLNKRSASIADSANLSCRAKSRHLSEKNRDPPTPGQGQKRYPR